ncbi:hypothetical protein ABI59_12640 [Acidobacteria bacterium Mor1]|nr:hypothetical protein ABI59_12640 [Acidobacteria bacterium Mor1]
MALALAVAFTNLLLAILVVILVIPMRQGKVPRNGIYGARFAASLESDEKWYPTNRYAAGRMMLWSIPAALSGLLALGGSPLMLIVAILAPAVMYSIACWESWKFARSL